MHCFDIKPDKQPPDEEDTQKSAQDFCSVVSVAVVESLLSLRHMDGKVTDHKARHI